MRLNKTALLGGVAALALGVGTAGFGVEAEAFDNVTWKWDKDINEIVTKTVNIDVNINPVGDITDQVLQMQIGNVHASSSTHDITNYKPLEEVQYTVGFEADLSLSIDKSASQTASQSASQTNTWDTQAKKTLDASLVAKASLAASNNSHIAHTANGFVETNGEGAAFFIGGDIVASGGGSIPPGAGLVVGTGGAALAGAFAKDGRADFEAAFNSTTDARTESNANLDLDVVGSLAYTDVGSSTKTETYEMSSTETEKWSVDIKKKALVTFWTVEEAVQDALLELPEVVDQATAIGNLVTVNSDVMVQEHSAQILFDTVGFKRPTCKNEQICEPGPVRKVNFEDADFDLDADLSLNDIEKDLHTNNHFHDLALLFGLAAGAGLIDKADISAKSEVYNIYNATGSAAATAIGNLKSISVDTTNPNNGVVLADVTQLSVADVRANAHAYNIDVVNYTNLGGLDRAIARSTATAIGNSLNITVNSGQNDGGAPGGNP
jgi:hypothetical protein